VSIFGPLGAAVARRNIFGLDEAPATELGPGEGPALGALTGGAALGDAAAEGLDEAPASTAAGDPAAPAAGEAPRGVGDGDGDAA
jgi:hypothetical protein